MHALSRSCPSVGSTISDLFKGPRSGDLGDWAAGVVRIASDACPDVDVDCDVECNKDEFPTTGCECVSAEDPACDMACEPGQALAGYCECVCRARFAIRAVVGGGVGLKAHVRLTEPGCPPTIGSEALRGAGVRHEGVVMEPKRVDQLGAVGIGQPTRRVIVRAGTKLAYAAPLVGASLALSARGAAAVSDGAAVAGNQSVPAGSESAGLRGVRAGATTNRHVGKKLTRAPRPNRSVRALSRRRRR